MKVASDVMLNKIVQKLRHLLCCHKHEDEYSNINHNHDEKYSGIDHKHDEAYAPKGDAIVLKDNSFNLNTQSYTADVNGKIHFVHVRTDEMQPTHAIVCIDQRMIPYGEDTFVFIPGIDYATLLVRRSSVDNELDFTAMAYGNAPNGVIICSVTSYA